MHPFLRACSLAAALVFLAQNSSVGGEICKPSLAFTDTRLYEMRDMQRLWSASLDVDASACSSTSGSFTVRFIRLKEYGPDLAFSEPFTWHAGRTEISLDFWFDEAVHDYAVIYVAPCPCRK